MEGCTAGSPRADTTCHQPSSVTYGSVGKPEQSCCCATASRSAAHSPPATGRICLRCSCSSLINKSRVRNHRSLPDAWRLLSFLSFKVVNKLVIRKRMMIVMAIVLNAVLTRGSTIHRMRHNHFRRELPSPFQRCDMPGPRKEDVVTGGWCSHRQRRSAQWALELRQTIGKTLCPFTVCEDRDPNRRPQNIHKIMCLEAGCRCTEEGSYRCVQVVDEMEVLYANDQETPDRNETWVPKKIKVEVGCVCAANVAQSGSTSFPNSLDD